MNEEKTLWGLCYQAEGGLWWACDSTGRGIFSRHRRVVLAHGHAMGTCSPEWLVARVGADGKPLPELIQSQDELERLVAEGVVVVQAGYVCTRVDDDGFPVGKGITKENAPASSDGIASASPDLNRRQLVYQFLDLPHYLRVKICHDLDLPMDCKAQTSEKQFAPSFRAISHENKLSEFQDAVEWAHGMAERQPLGDVLAENERIMKPYFTAASAEVACATAKKEDEEYTKLFRDDPDAMLVDAIT